MSRTGRAVKIKAEGLEARCFQHEIDHLNGILYLDHLDRPEDLRKVHEGDVEEEAYVEERT